MKEFKLVVKVFFFAGIVILITSCNGDQKPAKKNNNSKKNDLTKYKNFSGDSAYLYVEKQVAFGPRVPGTESHKNCKGYLFNTLKGFTDTAHIQMFRTKIYDNSILSGYNIIGSLNPLAM